VIHNPKLEKTKQLDGQELGDLGKVLPGLGVGRRGTALGGRVRDIKKKRGRSKKGAELSFSVGLALPRSREGNERPAKFQNNNSNKRKGDLAWLSGVPFFTGP